MDTPQKASLQAVVELIEHQWTEEGSDRWGSQRNAMHHRLEYDLVERLGMEVLATASEGTLIKPTRWGQIFSVDKPARPYLTKTQGRRIENLTHETTVALFLTVREANGTASPPPLDATLLITGTFRSVPDTWQSPDSADTAYDLAMDKCWRGWSDIGSMLLSAREDVSILSAKAERSVKPKASRFSFASLFAGKDADQVLDPTVKAALFKINHVGDSSIVAASLETLSRDPSTAREAVVLQAAKESQIVGFHLSENISGMSGVEIAIEVSMHKLYLELVAKQESEYPGVNLDQVTSVKSLKMGKFVPLGEATSLDRERSGHLRTHTIQSPTDESIPMSSRRPSVGTSNWN